MTSLIFLARAEGGGIGEMAAETAETFGLSWWLFISQCISFAIVAFLLHKFAYQPILNVLEVRRRKIEEGLANAEKIKIQLAEAQATSSDIVQKANAEAQKMIEEARSSAKIIGERQAQQAVSEAEQIIAKAREASTQERDRLLVELRREVTRLVIDTTSKVTGKILTAEDQLRLSEEASREIAA